MYPTKTFYSAYRTSLPEVYAVTFAIIIIVFFVYDMLVQIRNNKLVQTTARSNAIVSSLFPEAIRDRLIGASAAPGGGNALSMNHGKTLKSYIKGRGNDSDEVRDVTSEPLADLFVASTVLFADIVGFTAWSSVREPTQVFQLLETVYGEFDRLAKRRKVFKVEVSTACIGCTEDSPLSNICVQLEFMIFGRLLVIATVSRTASWNG